LHPGILIAIAVTSFGVTAASADSVAKITVDSVIARVSASDNALRVNLNIVTFSLRFSKIVYISIKSPTAAATL
jgi:hypothetical protein